MVNMVCNELMTREFDVDVGVIEYQRKDKWVKNLHIVRSCFCC